MEDLYKPFFYLSLIDSLSACRRIDHESVTVYLIASRILSILIQSLPGVFSLNGVALDSVILHLSAISFPTQSIVS